VSLPITGGKKKANQLIKLFDSMYSMENSLDTNLSLHIATISSCSSWTASPITRKVCLPASGQVALLNHFKATVTPGLKIKHMSSSLSTEHAQKIH